jgi:hypothetical protein
MWQGELGTIKSALDDVIEQGAPGYQQYLKNYAAASQPINAMELLQANRERLTNAKGQIMPDRFHRFVVDLASDRGARGLDPSKSIPDDVMGKLLDLNSDLKRMGNIDLGKARGSSTNLMGSLAQATGLAGAHAVAGAIAPGVGNMMVHGATQGYKAVIAPKLEARKLNKLTAQHLAPPPNPLAP